MASQLNGWLAHRQLPRAALQHTQQQTCSMLMPALFTKTPWPVTASLTGTMASSLQLEAHSLCQMSVPVPTRQA